MSQGHPFTSRAGFSTKLPDRATSSLHPQQPQFGQSAPTFPRRAEPSQTTNYGNYSNAPPPPVSQQQQPYNATGTGAAPSAYRQYPEKDSNVLHELSDEQKAEINEAFSLFDVDKDRHLDYHELRVALRALGFTISKQEALQIIQTNGVPKPTAQRLPPNRAQPGQPQPQYHASQLLIPQNAFTRIAAQKIHDRDPREEVERAFYLFDVDHKEYINLEDLRRVTRELGENSLEEQELQNMIEEFDYDGIGGVSKDAFFGICLQ
ncbi:Calcium-binding component of the spindle pole body (SPB) half-bridge [Lithohypha guttulata]|uniref:Calcium-binding component of the spindle pole body (SPB) half-bridge n=1 Tax=Lithohypha guttulata TaxID=1690604 RepID=A0AAN7Y7B5_9EURO|nr:Calcium-binding component of the spindle pole body (SPB) half-bridge [Lithohypha guttulata]KAK5087103.1 Calcium-binding component of the spindle pole body (SPB) half-bridge [Lithohypha guttulata]KAK5099833.1 Calcium-binding component of the spindle pole body (SPB) half-bridge [Lithohypha guttulata]